MRFILSIMIDHSLSGVFTSENYHTLTNREERLGEMIPSSHFWGETSTCAKLLLSPRQTGR